MRSAPHRARLAVGRPEAVWGAVMAAQQQQEVVVRLQTLTVQPNSASEALGVEEERKSANSPTPPDGEKGGPDQPPSAEGAPPCTPPPEAPSEPPAAASDSERWVWAGMAGWPEGDGRTQGGRGPSIFTPLNLCVLRKRFTSRAH